MKAVRLPPGSWPKRRFAHEAIGALVLIVDVRGDRISAGLILCPTNRKTASRKLEEIGFSDSALNVWVRGADYELFHCLPGADRTIDRSRAPDRARRPPDAR